MAYNKNVDLPALKLVFLDSYPPGLVIVTQAFKFLDGNGLFISIF